MGRRRGDEGVQATRSRSTRPRPTPTTPFNVYGWTAAPTMVKALEADEGADARGADGGRAQHGPRACHAAARHQGPDDARTTAIPIEAMQIIKFDGENWKLQGDVIEAKAD